MAPVRAAPALSVDLRASANSIVHGCPGVPRSIPRIDTTIELRSTNNKPISIRLVSIELRTIQKINIPSKIGSTDSVREYKIYDDIVFRPPTTDFASEVLGLDIPILFAIPSGITSSGLFPNWMSYTVHNLYVKVIVGDSYANETTVVEAFPVPIKVYDTLPLYRQFNETYSDMKTTIDKQVLVQVEMPVSSVGPSDDINVDVSVRANSLHNKIKKNLKLKSITFQIKEVIECHEGGITPRRESKLYTTTKDYTNSNEINNSRLTTQPITCHFQLKFPITNEFLDVFNSRNEQLISNEKIRDMDIITSANIHKYTFLDKLENGIPITHIQGFTSPGRFFSLLYEIVIKVKLIKGKDIDMRIPLIVSSYDRKSSEYILQWIFRECDVAKFKFGKDAINKMTMNKAEINNILQRYVGLPIIYWYNKRDWVKLGNSEDTFGDVKSIYID